MRYSRSKMESEILVLQKVVGLNMKSTELTDEENRSPIDEKKKKKKAGTESSKESSLRDWFGRKGAKGKKKGWVDCNAPDGDGGYKSCGRSEGESRKKYPACRPTPSACKERGKGSSWGKKAKKRKNEGTEKMSLHDMLSDSYGYLISESYDKEHKKELEEIVDQLHNASKMHKSQAERIEKVLKQLNKTINEEYFIEESHNCGCGKDPCETYGNQEESTLKFIIRSEVEAMLDEAKKKKKKKKKKAAKKDACYHKVKSRYKVWPSAYASGALVKCRKVGAKNWGNSTKEAIEAEIHNQILEILGEE